MIEGVKTITIAVCAVVLALVFSAFYIQREGLRWISLRLA